MEETTFELRNVGTADMFPVMNILGKIGFGQFKDKLTPENTAVIMDAFRNNGGDETDKDGMIAFAGISIFADIAEIVFLNMPKCESDIYKLLSSLSGKTQKEIAQQAPAITMEMIVEVIQKDEFKDFFKVASKLFS